MEDEKDRTWVMKQFGRFARGKAAAPRYIGAPSRRVYRVVPSGAKT